METKVIKALNQLVLRPSLENARALETILRAEKCGTKIFGRLNQKASIEAASESDRGITERIANAFDASLTTARVLVGSLKSDPTITPRIAAQRYLNPDTEACVWEPQNKKITFGKPMIQFWSEKEGEQLRFRKYQPSEGLITALVRDASLGMDREKMARTILELNSDDKLKTFEATGQFGHGGSSALAFCELCLILTQPRFEQSADEFYWTLIFPEPEGEASKQSLVRKWFCCSDRLPLRGNLTDFPELTKIFPGTSIWHFGYIRGDWLKSAVGTHQDSPAARLGRLFFSYPLPFEIHGELARADTGAGVRNVKGAYFRLLEDRSGTEKIVEYRTGEKSETLIVNGAEYGRFSIFVFVLKDRKQVRNYVDRARPVIITLHGQNHGERTAKLISDANLPEVAECAIVEIRLDGLEGEALSHIINNSREFPKDTAFTRELESRVRELLENDEALIAIEKKKQDENAKLSSEELNRKITKFLSSILSDAISEPSTQSGGGAPGKKGQRRGGPPLPEIPARNLPSILEFLSVGPVYIPEGTAKIIKFKSDARPPKYSFHGDNPRLFTILTNNNSGKARLIVSGSADIDGRGYGSVTLSCTEVVKHPIATEEIIGGLEIILQATDGRVLKAQIQVGVAPKPVEREKKRRQSIKPIIRFCAPPDADREFLAGLLVEDKDKVTDFGSGLEKYRDILRIANADCAYWGQECSLEGESCLTVEINVGHPRMIALLRTCMRTDDRARLKERVVQDVVLDCYQHLFRLDDLPEAVHNEVITQPNDDVRASEICLNYDKILRIATMDSKQNVSC